MTNVRRNVAGRRRVQFMQYKQLEKSAVDLMAKIQDHSAFSQMTKDRLIEELEEMLWVAEERSTVDE